MTAPFPVLQGLFDQARLVAQPPANLVAALEEHRQHRTGALSGLLADLVVPDQRLAEVSRAVGDGDPVSVCVVNTTGAGGLVALAHRSLPGLEIVGVQSGLRDLDDLTGNAARVVSAASELSESVAVYVEIPFAPGWERAVDAVESAGLLGAIRVASGGPDPESALVEQLSAFVEADLPFRVVGRIGSIGLLRAVHALVEGASSGDAADLLRDRDPRRSGLGVAEWDEPASARIRRRVQRLECASATTLLDELAAAGLSAAS